VKKVIVLADVPGWAWDKKARELKKHLDGGEFQVDVAYLNVDGLPQGYDLYHTFEVSQMPGVPDNLRKVTGITAHVWQTWEGRHGRGTVRNWAMFARGFHANSIMLQREMETYFAEMGSPRKIHYVPNGVDEQFYRRLRDRRDNGKLVVGHVGKPNPRKGHHLIVEACNRVGAELRCIQRTSKDALGAEEVREFYQDIHVLAVASDMDGTPNPALEAAACECAIVSNAIGNMPEFLTHGVNGHHVERTVESIADALRSISVERAIEMGRKARETIEREWTWKKLSVNYADMWREVLA
jgi:glycosyltransferase involved in cell wall biosynthesis